MGLSARARKVGGGQQYQQPGHMVPNAAVDLFVVTVCTVRTNKQTSCLVPITLLKLC